MGMIILTFILLIVAGIGGYYYLYQNNRNPLDDILSSTEKADASRLKDTKRKVDDQFNIAQQKKQTEIDRILDKINKKGMHALSSSERDFLQKYSKT
jgi:hypothetical protein